MDDDGMREPDRVEGIYSRLADSVRTRMEGAICRESEADIRIVIDLFAEILRNEAVGLSPAERDRRYRPLLSTL